MPIPTAFIAGAGTGAVGLYAVEKKLKSNGSGHTQNKSHTESSGIDMASKDSVMFGNSSASTHGAECNCCKNK